MSSSSYNTSYTPIKLNLKGHIPLKMCSRKKGSSKQRKRKEISGYNTITGPEKLDTDSSTVVVMNKKRLLEKEGGANSSLVRQRKTFKAIEAGKGKVDEISSASTLHSGHMDDRFIVNDSTSRLLLRPILVAPVTFGVAGFESPKISRTSLQGMLRGGEKSMAFTNMCQPDGISPPQRLHAFHPVKSILTTPSCTVNSQSSSSENLKKCTPRATIQGLSLLDELQNNAVSQLFADATSQPSSLPSLSRDSTSVTYFNSAISFFPTDLILPNI